MKRQLLLNLTLWLLLPLNAQPLLTLDEAIQTALNNSYGIQISRNDLEISANNANRGNAGFWPTVDVNAGGNLRLDNFNNQKFANGNEFINTNVFSRGVNAGVALNWTIFDGKRMFAAHERLKELQAMGELQVKAAVERTVYDVSLAYYDIVRLQLQLKAMDLNISVSEERLNLENNRASVGKGSHLQAKQAQLDLGQMKTRQAQLINQQQVAKIRLNQLMNRELETPFSVQDDMVLNDVQDIEALKQAALNANTELQILKKSVEINQQVLKEQEAEKYPVIALNANYGYSQNANSAGFQQFANNLGVNGGITLRWRIFDAGRVKRNIANTQLLIGNDRLSLQESSLMVHATITQAVMDYRNAVQIAEMEEGNHQLAGEALDIVKERFKLGVANTLELKDAQSAFDQSANRRALALHEAKMAEINLQFLTGQLWMK